MSAAAPKWDEIDRAAARLDRERDEERDAALLRGPAEEMIPVFDADAEAPAVEQTPEQLAEELEASAFLAEHGLDEAAPEDRTSLDIYLDRLLEKMRALRAKHAENTEFARRRIEMVQRWLEDENGTLERQYRWLEQKVIAHAAGYEYGDKKSRTLPNGKFGKKVTTKAGIRVVDEEAAIAFAKAQGVPAVKVTEKALVTPLKEWHDSTGLVPDGCERVAQVESFFVEVK